MRKAKFDGAQEEAPQERRPTVLSPLGGARGCHGCTGAVVDFEPQARLYTWQSAAGGRAAAQPCRRRAVNRMDKSFKNAKNRARRSLNG